MSASSDLPRRRVRDEAWTAALLAVMAACAAIAADLTFAAGRQMWSKPLAVPVFMGIAVFLSPIMVPWKLVRLLRRPPTDPCPHAPIAPVRRREAVSVAAVAIVAVAAWCWAALIEPMSYVAFILALSYAISAGVLTWTERRAGRIVLRIEDATPRPPGLRGYFSTPGAMEEVVTRATEPGSSMGSGTNPPS